MRLSHPLLAALALPALACQEYWIHGEDGISFPYDDAGWDLDRQFSIAFDVAFQRGSWGESVDRCQVEVAFHRDWESDGMNAGAAGAVIEIPEEPGSCMATWFDDEVRSEGAWHVAGSLSGAQHIYLHGQDQTLELALQDDAQGRLTYALADCDEQSFPFGEVFDLDVPAGTGPNGLPELQLEQVFGVGPELQLLQPGQAQDQGCVFHDPSQALDVAWEHLGAVPRMEGAPLEREELVFLRNNELGQELSFEALACLPDAEGQLVIPADDLLQLSPNQDLEALDPYVAFQVDARYYGPVAETPWGQASRVSSTVTSGGILILLEE